MHPFHYLYNIRETEGGGEKKRRGRKRDETQKMWDTQGQRVRRKGKQGIWARVGQGGKCSAVSVANASFKRTNHLSEVKRE